MRMDVAECVHSLRQSNTNAFRDLFSSGVLRDFFFNAEEEEGPIKKEFGAETALRI